MRTGAGFLIVLVFQATHFQALSHGGETIYVQFDNRVEARLLRSSVELRGEQPGLEPLADEFRALCGHRVHQLSSEQIDGFRDIAEVKLGHSLPDPNLAYYFECPAPLAIEALLKRLNASPWVHSAHRISEPLPPPLPPDFTHLQTYFGPAPGLDLDDLSAFPGSRGAGVEVADLEYGWTPGHLDYALTIVGTPSNPFDNFHGEAVVGLIAAGDNGFGVTGIAPLASVYGVPTISPSGVWSIPSAITTAMSLMEPGGIILIEQQVDGPNYSGSAQLGLVPVEWYFSIYQAIQLATANGYIVVEPAGNGSEDLDQPEYMVGHAPFAPGNDSGAIVVGAGSSTTGLPLGFTNRGSRVDVQAWGYGVATCGYGNLYSSEGETLYYTFNFGGTSSASALVAGIAASLQGVYTTCAGEPMTAEQLREALVSSGFVTAGTGEIGPVVQGRAALEFLFEGRPRFIRGDATDDGGLNIADPILILESLFGGGPSIECFDAADANRSQSIDLADPIYLLNVLFGTVEYPTPSVCCPDWEGTPDCDSYQSCP